MNTKFCVSSGKQLCFLVFLLLNISIVKAQKVTILKPSDKNINSKINRAKPGDEIRFEPGNYKELRLQNINGTKEKPIVLKRNKPNGVVNFRGSYDPNDFWSGKTAAILKNSKYVVFDKLTFTRASNGFQVIESDHVIFKDCEIFNIGSNGLKISKNTKKNNNSTDYSHHIDWIGGKIHDTGKSRRGQYGEAIYIGQAQQNTDKSHDIWIEAVEIFNIKGGEGIDVKPEVYNITIKNCYLHDIKLYAVENDQVNDAAIQVIASTDKASNNETTRHHELWIENNTIEKITTDSQNNSGNRGNGIAITGRPGVYIKNNKIKNVQHSGIAGFYGKGLNPGYEALVDKNTMNQMSNIGSKKININNGKYKIINAIKKNPNAAQTWYRPNTSNPDPDPDPDPTPSPTIFPKIESFSAQQDINPASGLIDKSTADNDRWSIRNNGVYPHWAVIDYGETKNFIGSKLWTFGNRAYRYKIEVSNNVNSGYVTIVNRQNNAASGQPIIDSFNAASGRYVKITITGAHNYSGSWMSLRELEMIEGVAQTDKIVSVEAPSSVTRGNTALVKVAYSASTNRDIVVGFQKNSTPYTNYGITRVNVAAGSGTLDVQVPINSNTPIANGAYQFQTYITVDGSGYNDRLSNIVKTNIDCTANNGSITIRAKGTCGQETMKLKVNGSFVKTWNNVSTSYKNYTYNNYRNGKVEVHFTNDGSSNGCNRNLTVDHITICNTTYQTENKASRTGCGNTQMLWCNGRFDFGDIGCSNRSANSNKTKEITPSFAFENPVSKNLEIRSQGVYSISVYNTNGQPLLQQQNLVDNQVLDISQLPEGMYFVTYTNQGYKETKKIIIKR